MSKIDSLWDSVKQVINNRLSSPFYFVFALSWLSINWEFVYLVCFTNIDSFKTLHHIKTELTFYKSVCKPIWVGFSILILGGVLSIIGYAVDLSFQNLKSWLTLKINRLKPVNANEYRALIDSLNKMQKEYNELDSSSNLEIQQLKSQLKNALKGSQEVSPTSKSGSLKKVKTFEHLQKSPFWLDALEVLRKLKSQELIPVKEMSPECFDFLMDEELVVDVNGGNIPYSVMLSDKGKYTLASSNDNKENISLIDFYTSTGTYSSNYEDILEVLNKTDNIEHYVIFLKELGEKISEVFSEQSQFFKLLIELKLVHISVQGVEKFELSISRLGQEFLKWFENTHR